MTTVLDPVLTPEIVRTPTVEPIPNPQPPTPDHPAPNPANLLTLPAAYVPDDAPRQGLQVRFDLYDEAIFRTVYEKGEPVSFDEVFTHDLISALAHMDGGQTAVLQPQGTLFCARDGLKWRVAIFLPPQVRKLYLDGEAEPLAVPLPSLIFYGRGDVAYSVFALNNSAWPGPDAQLYHAPFPNIYTGTGALNEPGGVCRGSAEFPACSLEAITGAIETFFASNFNHDLARGKSHQYQDSIIRQWRALAQAEATEYPLEDLVSTGKVLKELL